MKKENKKSRESKKNKAFISAGLIILVIIILIADTVLSLSLADIPDYTIQENNTLSFNLIASEYNNTVIFSMQPEKGTLTKINNTLAEYEWTPTLGENGTYIITFSAADHTESVSKQTTITVTKQNNPPIILSASAATSPKAAVTVDTNKASVCKYSLSNKNYEQMDYTMQSLNTEKTEHQGELPSLSQGPNTIYVLCNDENGNYMTSPRQIVVNINSKPTASISLNPDQPLKEGTVKIELTTNEPLISTPELKYSFDDDSSLRNIALIGSGTSWEGYLVIKDEDNERVGSFYFKGYDLTNQEGTEITSGKLFLIDTLNPKVLQSISIENMDDKLKLAWEKPNSEKIKEYKIYKKTGSGGVEEVDYYDSTDKEYIYDEDVEYNIGYYYRVSVVDKAGNEGPLSKEVFITHIPVINTNKITSETKTSDKTEISQKLDSKLEYILNNEIQNVGNAQKDIEKAEETLSRTLGSDNIDAIDALGALTALAESKSKIISLKSELDKLKSQDLSEEEFNNLISGITNQVDIALKSAPLEVKIIDSSSYQEFTNDEKTTSTISSYLAEYYPDLSDRELKSKLDEAKKLQDKLVVNVKLIKGETKYKEETKPFLIVKKTLTSDETLDKILLFENIPSSVGDISGIKFSEQPFLDQNYAFWNIEGMNEKKITYVQPLDINLADAKAVKSIIFSEQDLIKNTDGGNGNMVTGDAINIPDLSSDPEGKEGIFLALIIAGVLVICGLFAYYVFWSEAEPKEKTKNSNQEEKISPQELDVPKFSVTSSLFKRRKSIMPDDSHRKIIIEKPDESIHQVSDNMEFRRIVTETATHQELKNESSPATKQYTKPTDYEDDSETKEDESQKVIKDNFVELKKKLVELKESTTINNLEGFDSLRAKTYEIKRLCDELEEQSVIEFTNKTRADLEKSLLYIARHVPPSDFFKEKDYLFENQKIKSYNDKLTKTKNPPLSDNKDNYNEIGQKEVTESKEHLPKINQGNLFRNAPEGREFVFSDGGRISTISGLRNKLIHSSDASFNEYVTSNKNDFATWISDIFNDYDLAYKVRNTKTREELIKLLDPN